MAALERAQAAADEEEGEENQHGQEYSSRPTADTFSGRNQVD